MHLSVLTYGSVKMKLEHTQHNSHHILNPASCMQFLVIRLLSSKFPAGLSCSAGVVLKMLRTTEAPGTTFLCLGYIYHLRAKS